MRNTKKAPRVRRGSMSVFMVLVMLVVISVAAVALDLGRMHTGYAELQTEADAAALKGASRIQLAPGVNPRDTVLAFDDSANWVLEGNRSVDSTGIVGIRWRPDSVPNAVTVGWSSTTNAVQVTARRYNGLLFGRLLNAQSAAATPSRMAIAWLANVRGVQCEFEPVGIPISNLFSAIGSGNINTRPLTQLEVARIDSMLGTLAGRVALTQILYPKDNSITPTTETSIYWPLADNMKQYADQISRGGGCPANAGVEVNGEESPFSGSGGGSPGKKLVDGVLASAPTSGSAICQRIPNDATCYDPLTGTAGITLTVSYTGGGTTYASCPTNCTVPVRMIAGFRLVCVFYGRITGSGPNGQVNNAERCPWLHDNFSPAINKAYEVGTLVGYPVTTAPGLNSGISLGNSPSLAQRLILVR